MRNPNSKLQSKLTRDCFATTDFPLGSLSTIYFPAYHGKYFTTCVCLPGDCSHWAGTSTKFRHSIEQAGNSRYATEAWQMCIFVSCSSIFRPQDISTRATAKVQAIMLQPMGCSSNPCYYCKILSNLTNILAPCIGSYRKNTKWIWWSQEIERFQTAKESLISDCVLIHFVQQRSWF